MARTRRQGADRSISSSISGAKCFLPGALARSSRKTKPLVGLTVSLNQKWQRIFRLRAIGRAGAFGLPARDQSINVQGLPQRLPAARSRSKNQKAGPPGHRACMGTLLLKLDPRQTEAKAKQGCEGRIDPSKRKCVDRAQGLTGNGSARGRVSALRLVGQARHRLRDERSRRSRAISDATNVSLVLVSMPGHLII